MSTQRADGVGETAYAAAVEARSALTVLSGARGELEPWLWLGLGLEIEHGFGFGLIGKRWLLRREDGHERGDERRVEERKQGESR